MRTHFNVPAEEIILGTLFIFPKDAESRANEVVPGKLRDKGKALDTWSKKVWFRLHLLWMRRTFEVDGIPQVQNNLRSYS